MIKPEVLDAMVAAGCTAEQIVAAVKADAQSEDARAARKREVDAVRKRRQRERERESHAVSRGHTVTDADTPIPLPPSDKERSPTPPKETNSPLTPNPRGRERGRSANPIVILQSEVDAMAAQRWVTHCEDKGRRVSAAQAEELASILKQVRALGGNPTEALTMGIRKGWVTIEIEYLRNAGMQIKADAASDPIEKLRSWPEAKWRTLLDHSRERGEWSSIYGPAPGEPGCLVPPNLVRETDLHMRRVAA